MSVIAKFHSRQNAPLPAGWDTLFSAVLSDALDAYGAPGYAMSPRMRPLDDNLKMCGRARTGAYMEMPYVAEGTNPYELEIAIVDDLRPGDVAIFACGGSNRIAPWGGLLSTATRARGAAGCVTDGFVRDIIEIRSLIRGLAAERTVILSTHILPEVQQICRKVVLINAGRIALEADMEDLVRKGSLEQEYLRHVTGDADFGKSSAAEASAHA